jgi:hypothetical protein
MLKSGFRKLDTFSNALVDYAEEDVTSAVNRMMGNL